MKLLNRWRAWRDRKRLTKTIATMEALQTARKPITAEDLNRLGEVMLDFGKQKSDSDAAIGKLKTDALCVDKGLVDLEERVAKTLYDVNRNQFIASAYPEWSGACKDLQEHFQTFARAVISELGLTEEVFVLDVTEYKDPEQVLLIQTRYGTPWNKRRDT